MEETERLIKEHYGIDISKYSEEEQVMILERIEKILDKEIENEEEINKMLKEELESFE